MRQKLSIVIPAYNEAATIHLILDKIRQVALIGDLEKEVIIVNDCSTDRTKAAIQAYMTAHPAMNIQYLEHAANQGKGAALHSGIRQAAGQYIVIQDADLEYDPGEYNVLLRPLLDDRADVVYGSRFIGGKPHRILFFWHSIGNKFLTFLSNACTNLNLTDMETCYKVFRRKVVDDVTPKLKQDRFGFEPEITARIARRQFRIYEMSVSYSGRTYEQGKKIGWRDGVKALWCIVRYGIAD